MVYGMRKGVVKNALHEKIDVGSCNARSRALNYVRRCSDSEEETKISSSLILTGRPENLASCARMRRKAKQPVEHIPRKATPASF